MESGWPKMTSFMYLGPHLECLEWMGFWALPLSMRSFTPAFSRLTEAFLEGESKRIKPLEAKVQKLLSLFCHILVKQSTRTEQIQREGTPPLQGKNGKVTWQRDINDGRNGCSHLCK